MFPNENYLRRIRLLEARVAALERLLRGLRTERRARWRRKRTTYQGVVSEPGGIPAGGSGEVTIYRKGQPTPWKVTAFHVWMHGGDACEYDTEVQVKFWEDKNRFELEDAACAPGGDHVALP